MKTSFLERPTAWTWFRLILRVCMLGHDGNMRALSGLLYMERVDDDEVNKLLPQGDRFNVLWWYAVRGRTDRRRHSATVSIKTSFVTLTPVFLSLPVRLSKRETGKSMTKLFDYEPLPAVVTAGAEMNAAQRRAIEHGAGPLLVIAGAGTGKTRGITERIRHLFERDSSLLGENILGLTFTKKAAGEMLRRVRKTCGERADGITLTTFHAFCETILKEGAPGRLPLEQ